MFKFEKTRTVIYHADVFFRKFQMNEAKMTNTDSKMQI